MSRVCRPRISGRCPWSGAGEGSAAERFDWLVSDCCSARTGSDLAERKGKVFYFTLRNIFATYYWINKKKSTHQGLLSTHWATISIVKVSKPLFVCLVYLYPCPECGLWVGWGSASLLPDSSAPSPVCPL